MCPNIAAYPAQFPYQKKLAINIPRGTLPTPARQLEPETEIAGPQNPQHFQPSVPQGATNTLHVDTIQTHRKKPDTIQNTNTNQPARRLVVAKTGQSKQSSSTRPLAAEQPKSKSKSRLGRGLSSLLGDPVPVEPPIVREESGLPAPDSVTPAPSHSRSATVPSSIAESAPAGTGLAYIPVDRIVVNPRQPRQSMNQQALESLAASIRRAGVMQPIVVRVVAGSGGDAGQTRYQLVAGERRWRAARIANLASIPAVVRDLSEAEAAEFALIENLQREDLNPIERAEAFQKLMDEFELTQAQVSERVGVDRSTIGNLLRLNTLDEHSKSLIRDGRLGFGHAKALLACTDFDARRELAKAVIEEGWSVRELETRIEKLRSESLTRLSGSVGGATAAGGSSAGAHPSRKRASSKPDYIINIENRLSQALGLRAVVRLHKSRQSGDITFRFASVAEFEQFVKRVGAADDK